MIAPISATHYNLFWHKRTLNENDVHGPLQSRSLPAGQKVCNGNPDRLVKVGPDHTHQPGFIAFLSALAEDERQRILKRANDGRLAARKHGAKFGRKPKLSEHQQAKAKHRLAKGETCRAIARSFGAHHATISRLG